MATPKTIVITGASSGIGAAAARRFAMDGWNIVLVARRLDRLESLASELESAGAAALPLAADVSQVGQVQDLARAALDRFGAVDVLFNNAGFGRMNWVEELDPESDVAAQVNTNLLGLIYTTQALLPHMITRRSGHILNMSSVAGLLATPTYSVYAATKFAVRGFTEALRREVGVYGIHVTGIYPGAVKTEFAENAGIRRKTGLRTPPALNLTAEGVADRIYRAVEHPRRSLVLPGYMHLAVWANRLFPALVDWAVERAYVRKERT
jgi:uncharacterized protein